MLSFKKLLTLGLIGLSSASMYTLVYIRYYFYDDWLAAMGVSNQAAGFLYTAYAVGCTLGYLPGGWVADRYPLKRIFTWSLTATAGFNFLFAVNQSYYLALFLWFALALTSGFGFWAGLIKAVRLTGGPEEQGRAYGVFGAAEGLCTSLIMAVALWSYDRLGGGLAGFQSAVVVYGVFCLVAVLLVNLLYRESAEDAASREENRIRLADVRAVLRTPTVWVLSVMVYCTYGLFNSTSYLTPYLTGVLGASPTSGAVMGVIRLQLFAFLIGPAAGWLADRIGAPSKLVAGGHLIVVVLLAALLCLPLDPSAMGPAIVIMLAISAVLFSFYLIMFSTIEEMGFPRRVTGTVVGVVSMLGYSSDMLFSPTFGYWLDTYGNDGYTYIFLFLIGNGLLGSSCALWLRLRGRRLVGDRAEAREVPEVIEAAK